MASPAQRWASIGRATLAQEGSGFFQLLLERNIGMETGRILQAAVGASTGHAYISSRRSWKIRYLLVAERRPAKIEAHRLALGGHQERRSGAKPGDVFAHAADQFRRVIHEDANRAPFGDVKPP